MVDTKYSTTIIKARGSKALLASLQKGDIKSIAERFNETYTQVFNVLGGKHAGNKEIIECAERIVAFYAEIRLIEKRNEILDSYGNSN